MAIKTRSRARTKVVGADWSGTAPRPAAAGAGTVRATSAGAGLALIGVLAVLEGAWGGIVPYVGPAFGFSSNGIGSFTWTLQHALIYLIPGAVALVAGLYLLALRRSSTFIGLLLAACGAWFILAVPVWPILYSSPTVFTVATPTNGFINLLGYNLGPGIVLALLGGMAFAASPRR
ncbi:MAG: hypothetical protein ACRDX8_00960 [Acidimicrobiales bacterium]